MTWLLLLTLLIETRPTVKTFTRIKELATVEGVRDNQLIGYGLVVGLAGTGDRRQTVFSAQSLANMLERMGISVPSTSLRVANMAAVIVTATLPPFAQSGTRIDVTAASARIAAAVNQRFGSAEKPVARAENSAVVSIQMPASYLHRPIEFMADVEALSLEPDRLAKVVINERTGTIVMGKEVRIAPTAILH